jgi:hypothetical protein
MTAEPSALAVVVPDNVDPSPDRSVALERDGSHRRLEDLDPSYDPGPFPECLGEIAEDCVAMIEARASDVYTIIVRPPVFNYHRVLIRVDEDNLVDHVPARG